MLNKNWLVRNNRGFTVIELVVVILILGIVSVIIVPKWTATSLNLEYQARRVLNDIRYTQALSMLSGERYRWVRTSTTSYQIINEAGTPVILPSGSTSLTLTNGASFGAFSNLPNNLIAFDSRGIPYINNTYPGTALASAATIPLSAGSVTRSIQIQNQTGFGVLQ